MLTENAVSTNFFYNKVRPMLLTEALKAVIGKMQLTDARPSLLALQFLF